MIHTHGRAYQQELFYDSSVQTQDVVWKTGQEWWKIGINRERKLGKSIQAMLHDVDDYIITIIFLDYITIITLYYYYYYYIITVILFIFLLITAVFFS